MKTIDISMPTKKFEDQSVIHGNIAEQEGCL